MGIFSFFNLKKDFSSVFTKENIAKLKEYIVEQIVMFVNNAELKGPQKKIEVDKKVIAYINTNFKTNNTIIQYFVTLLIQFEPQISQWVYDMLKEYIDGLTEKLQDK